MSFLGLGRTREKVEAWLVQYKWCGLAEEWCKIFKMHCCNHSFLYISNIAVSNGLITCVGRSDFDLDFFPMRLRMLPSTWMIKNSFQIFGLNIFGTSASWISTWIILFSRPIDSWTLKNNHQINTYVSQETYPQPTLSPSFPLPVIKCVVNVYCLYYRVKTKTK